MTPEKCFACNRSLRGRKPHLVDTRDAQLVFVGPDCYEHVLAAGSRGYQPPRGGPRLYTISPSTDPDLLALAKGLYQQDKKKRRK